MIRCGNDMAIEKSSIYGQWLNSGYNSIESLILGFYWIT